MLKNIFFLIAVVIFVICTSTGCKSTPVPGDESLVEARIIAAVNAERTRWVASLNQYIRDGLRDADARVDAVEGGLQQVTAAAREYRAFVLDLIDRLQHIEDQGREEGQVVVGRIHISTWVLSPEDDTYDNND